MNFAKNILAIVFYLCASCGVLAQWQAVGGGRAAAMGHAAAPFTDAWAVFNNVGALPWAERPALLFAYDNRFSVAGLATVAAGYTTPLPKGLAAGVAVSRFGDELLNHTSAGIGLGHKIANYSIGLKVNYVQMSLLGLGTRGRLVMEFGGLGQLSKQLWVAAHIYNFTQARLADFQDERLPTVMKAAIAYRPNHVLALHLETEKDILFPARIKAGLEYWVVEKLALRTGVATQPWVSSYGMGLKLRRWQVDYALATHPQLLPAHQLSLIYQWANKAALPPSKP